MRADILFYYDWFKKRNWNKLWDYTLVLTVAGLVLRTIYQKFFVGLFWPDMWEYPYLVIGEQLFALLMVALFAWFIGVMLGGAIQCAFETTIDIFGVNLMSWITYALIVRMYFGALSGLHPLDSLLAFVLTLQVPNIVRLLKQFGILSADPA
jgi:hypothetical protein